MSTETLEWEPSEAELGAAIRAAYDDQPQWFGGTMTRPSERRPKTFEESYGCAPLEHPESVRDTALILIAAHRAALAAREDTERPDDLRGALAELVRLRDLKEHDPDGYANEGSRHKGDAWRRARVALRDTERPDGLAKTHEYELPDHPMLGLAFVNVPRSKGHYQHNTQPMSLPEALDYAEKMAKEGRRAIILRALPTRHRDPTEMMAHHESFLTDDVLATFEAWLSVRDTEQEEDEG
jgi:hypothetical protein